MLRCHQQQNLGDSARGKAVTLGVILAGVAVGWTLLAAELGLTKQLGWLMALPTMASAYLLISGTFGICIYNGMRGHRGADHGTEAVLDPQNRAQLRTRGLLALSASVVIAGCFAAVLLASS